MYDQFLMYLTLTLAQPTDSGLNEIRCSVVVSDPYNQLRNDDFDVDGGAYDGRFHALIFRVYRPQQLHMPDPVVAMSSLSITESSNEDSSPGTLSLDFSRSGSEVTSPRSSSEESE